MRVIIVTCLCIFFVGALVVMIAWAGRYYRPIPRRERERLHSKVLRHYVPTKHLQQIPGGVVLQARLVKRAPWIFLWPPRRESLFFYTTRHGQGAKLNHGNWKGEPYSRVDVDGPDFLDRIGHRPIYWRPFDGAVAVFQDYAGPAAVTRDVDPRADRSGL